MNREFLNRWNLPVRTTLVIVVLSLLFGGSKIQGAQNRPTQEVKDFMKAVDAYVTLHKKLLNRMPALKKPDDPVEIAMRRQLLEDAIRAERSHAKQGDIFKPIVVPQFLQIIRQDAQRRTRADLMALIEEGPSEKLVSKPNQPYPPAAKINTMPALLLSRLPPLPKELEYRFVGRHFILRDTGPNIIVDFIPNAVPLPKPTK